MMQEWEPTGDYIYLSTVGGKRVDLQGPLFVDMFEHFRLLANGYQTVVKSGCL